MNLMKVYWLLLFKKLINLFIIYLPSGEMGIKQTRGQDDIYSSPQPMDCREGRFRKKLKELFS